MHMHQLLSWLVLTTHADWCRVGRGQEVELNKCIT